MNNKSLLDDCISFLEDKEIKRCKTFAREEELLDLIDCLKDEHNYIIGNPGSGKTTIIEQLAYFINKEKIDGLEDISLLYIKTDKLLLSKIDSKDKIDKLDSMLKEAGKRNSIVVLDNIDLLLSNNVKCNSDIRKMIDKSDLRVIGLSNNRKLSCDYAGNYIYLNELDDNTLKRIIKGKCREFSKLYNVSNKDINSKLDNISDTLITFSKSFSNVHDSNPGFIVDILEDAYENACIEENKSITVYNIIGSVNNYNDECIDNSVSNCVIDLRKAKNKSLFKK